MAYDEVLAERIRELLADDPTVTEMRMFGGLAFMVGGAMAVAASGKGGCMVRVDPGEVEVHWAEPGVQPMEMRGRPVDGWVRVDAAAVGTRRQLEAWVAVGTAAARSAPPRRR